MVVIVIDDVNNISEIIFKYDPSMTDLPNRNDISGVEEVEDKGMDIVGQMLEIFVALSCMAHVKSMRILVSRQRPAAVGWSASGRWRCGK